MAEDAANRTEEPTPKRREEARSQGRVPQSVEVTSAAVLISALLVMSRHGGDTVAALREVMRRSLLAISAVDLTPGQVGDLMWTMASDSVRVLAPILLVTAAVGFVTTVAQVGFQVTGKLIKPDASKLSPATGFKRIVSTRGLVELGKALAKIALVAWITWKLVGAAESTIVGLAGADPREILHVAGRELARMIGWATGALSVLAAADYGWQRRQHHQSLKMSREEVKDERRQSEGDPQIRQRVKRAYQQLAKRRSLAEVPKADVVVTNPVHLAVALRYVPGQMGAPTVVAKGAEHMAVRIKDLARRHGIPIVERRSLARALFRTVPVGREIPATLYRAVAEILAYLYALRTRRAG